MRLVGERKACAAIVLAFFSLLFFLNGLVGPPAFQLMFYSLCGAYFLAFFSLVAGYFWARWYALGLAFSGLAMAIMMWWQIGLDPAVILWGGTHLVITLSLIGKGPASAFDGRKEWRERYKMDENAANRLGKAIMRAGASLPYLILAGLAPKQGMGAVFALVIGVVGLWGLVRLRTWGVLALAGSAVMVLASAGGDTAWFLFDRVTAVPSVGALAGALLLIAVVPFAGPIFRTLTRRAV